MKVGLMTCFVDNYGACLQAYAIQKFLQDGGRNQVEIMKYIGVAGYTPDDPVSRILRNPFFKWIRCRVSSSYAIHFEKRKKFDNFRNQYLHFSDRSYHSNEELKKQSGNYDAYVCGSDQIWNPVIFHRNERPYFLDFAPEGKKRVAYAPSIGISSIPEEFREEMADLLNHMDVLSAREKTGSDIVTALTGRECRTVLDPTLLLSGDQWREIASRRQIEDPYIFLYLFGTREYIGKFVDYVRKKTGMKVVAIPYVERERKPEYTVVDAAGPEDFVSLIANASLVITDSFHATAFSSNLNIPFYTLLRNEKGEKNNMNSRVTDILNMLQLQHRLIASEQDFPAEIDFNVDFTSSNRILEARRAEDGAFLLHSLD